LEKSLVAKLLGTGEASPSDEAETLRARILARVRRENPPALRDPLRYESYLHGVAVLEAGAAQLLVEDIVNDILGYGPIQPYIYPVGDRYRDVTEVMISRYDRVYVEMDGRLVRTGTVFRSEEHLHTVARKIVMSAGKRIDESEPIVDARLPDGSRVNVMIPPVSVDGATVVVRRFPRMMSLEELVERGALTEEAVSFLREAVAAGLNLVVTGPMGSGKTTVLNALVSIFSDEWGPEASLVIFEDVAELQPRHENVRRLESRPPNMEGKGEITIAYLVQTAMLRLRPDLIVLGECRGREAYYVTAAMCIGHPVMTTFHAVDAVDAVRNRLPGMIMMSAEGKAEGTERVLDRVAGAVDVVVHMSKVKEGDRRMRRVVQIAEVLTKEAPSGRAPDPRLVFRYRDGKLVRCLKPEIFEKKKVVFQ
jgi:pilus assembly protein CpaF